MRWFRAGAWLVGTGLALVGASAGVASLQQLTAAGIAGIAAGAALTFVGFLLLAFGGRSYLREQQQGEKERNAREVERARLDIERLEFEKERLKFDRQQLEAQQADLQRVPSGSFWSKESVDANTDAKKRYFFRTSAGRGITRIPVKRGSIRMPAGRGTVPMPAGRGTYLLGPATKESLGTILESQLATSSRRERQIDQEIDDLKRYTARIGKTL